MGSTYHGQFTESPVGSTQAEGWLGSYCRHMLDNLTGRLDECGYPFSTDGFACDAIDIGRRRGAEWWPYEQVGYWLDGLTRCALALGDEAALAKADAQIDYVLEHADDDGFLGPDHLRSNQRQDARWGLVPFLRALMARHDADASKGIDQALAEHFLGHEHPHAIGREPTAIEQMCWAYARTGDARLLEQACRVYEFFNHKGWIPECTVAGLRSGRPQAIHGVTFNEFAKLPAILYLWTGNAELIDACVRGYETLLRDHMLVSGVHSSDEHLGGQDSQVAIEICDIADFTWSLGYVLQATGEVRWADMIERACLNAGTGAATGDFTGHQYYTAPNQALATDRCCFSHQGRGSNRMQYRPNPDTECCSGNVHRIMPNYVARMWMRAGDDTLAAVLYGPSKHTATLAGVPVTITQATDFPFEDRIRFTIHCASPVLFTLRLRIPGWAEGASFTINGVPADIDCPAGSFVDCRRSFADGDSIELHLPMRVRMTRWPEHGVALERGPLVYSLPIETDLELEPIDERSCEGLPPQSMRPGGPWNYALDLSEDQLDQIEIERLAEVGDTPWSPAQAPLALRVPVRRIARWRLIEEEYTVVGCQWHNNRRYSRGPFVFTPPLPIPELVRATAGEQETVRFIPHGCAKLRMTVLPQALSMKPADDVERAPITFM